MKKEIEGFPGYWIYDDGRVWSDKRNKFLKPSASNNSYQHINFRKAGKTISKYIHRLVAEAFIPNPDNLPEINHKDEDKTNNCVDNLEWCSRKYNCNYGTRLQKTGNKKSSCAAYQNNKLVKQFNSIKEAADWLGNIKYRTGISRCLNGHQATSYGYIWKYA